MLFCVDRLYHSGNKFLYVLNLGRSGESVNI